MFETEDRRHPEHPLAYSTAPARSDDWIDRLPTYDLPEHDAGSDDPLDSEEGQATHAALMSYYRQELYVQEPQRRQMMEDEAFFDGDQWSLEEEAILHARNQYPMVYNVIAPAVMWLLGTERRARTDFKVLPRNKNGSAAAERKSKLLKYLSDVNRSEYDTSRSFADAVKAGVGWLEEGYQGEEEGEPVYSRYESWRNILWDSRATELDLSDARYLFRAKWTDTDIAAQFFPGRESVITRAQFSNFDISGMGGLDGYSDEAMDEAEMSHDANVAEVGVRGGRKRHRVRLIEAWYRKPVQGQFIKGGEFNGDLYDPASPGHVEDVLGDSPTTVVSRVKMRVHVAVFTTAGLLYQDLSPYRHNHLPFTPIWGNRRASDGMPYGLIRNMKDIQRDINKRASKALHILSTNRVIMDEGAVEDVDELAEEVNRPDGIIEKKRNHHLEIDNDREMASAHLELMSRGVDMLQQQSGITDEAMGRTTNAASGKAIVARQTQGSVAISHFLDNLRLGLQIHGEKKLSLVEQYFTKEKSFRITNSRGTPTFIDINNDGLPENDIIRTKADFVISEDDWKASMRQAQLEELMELVQQLAPTAPNVVLVLLDLLIEASDIPYKDEIVARVRKINGQTDPDIDEEELEKDPDYVAQKALEAEQNALQMRGAMAEVAEKEATAAEKAAKAQKTEVEAQRAQASLTNDNIESVVKALQAAVDMLSARPAVPLADEILAGAQTTAQGGAAAPAPLPPTPETAPTLEGVHP